MKVLLVMGLFFAQTGFPQNHIVQVYGTITDTAGIGISWARVSFISQANGDTTSTQTDTIGDYSIQLVLTQTDVEKKPPLIPKRFQLYQNYPNPFNPGTIIEFKLPQVLHLKLTVFNLRGQIIKVIADGFYPAGLSRVCWDGTNSNGKGVAAGIYFYRLETEQFAEARKMLLLDGGEGTIGSTLTSSRKSLLKSKMLFQETFTICAEKDEFYPFVEENFVVTTEDTALEKNVILVKKVTWQSLGFEDKLALRLRLYEPYLYVCAGSDGLWRKDIKSEYSDWEYLGMADTTLGDYRGVMDVLVNSENPDVMLVAFFPDSGTAHGIFKTEDGGNTWFASDSGLEFHFPPPRDDETYFEHPAIFLQTPYDLFAAGTKIVHTNNFGETWEAITPIDAPVPIMWTHAFRCHSQDTNILWLGGVSVFCSPILLFSTNSGVTWDYVYLDTIVTVDNAVYSIAFDPYDSDVVYVGLLMGELIKTTDGGNSWIVLQLPDSAAYFRYLVEDETQSGHLFTAASSTAGSTIMETEDGGVSWIDLKSPNDGEVIFMIYDSEENALYIGTRSGPLPSGVFVYK
ncbi:MAG: T9SS type A sorting domain-containing protein [bacterium]